MMSDQIRTKVINYISNAFFAGGLLNIISQYHFYDNPDLKSILIFSGSLIFIGFILQVIQRSKVSKNIKDVLITVIISLLVPIITLRFIDYASITIWAFPFIFLIITLVFGRRFIRISLTISILLTQILVWMIKPHVLVSVDATDYVVRIGIYIIAIWFAFYINKIFLSKLNENAYQINSQKIIAEISSEYVSVNDKNFDEKTNSTLNRMGAFLNMDRVCIYLFDSKYEKLTCKHKWINEIKVANKEVLEDISAGSYPCLMNQIIANKVIHVPDINELSAEAYAEMQSLLSPLAKSLICLPIENNCLIHGFLLMESFNIIKKLPDNQIHFFNIITNIFADAAEKVNQEKEINHMAYYDYLTKLPNRLLFKERVEQSISLADSTGKMLAIIFLDMDSFKTVNDTMGHNRGDDLLVKISKELSKSVGEDDTVCRFGGDEFLIMLNNIDTTNDIIEKADKIMSIFNSHFYLNNQEFFVTATAGISVYPFDGESADKLIKNADIAMYKAKEKGKNQYLLCSAAMKDEIQLKMKLSNSLYRALERNELIIQYQPQISIATRNIIGTEALLRWYHPEMGIISPGLFIPLAEQSGLIGPIGEWVLRTACTQSKKWQDAGLPAIRMAVNVSIVQFRNPNLVSQVRNTLKEIGLDPKYLELEITESIAVNESDYVIQVLGDLKELGISISIDDFGTEYSSLSRLNMMPIDRIKMDTQFIRGISRSDKEKAIAKGIINLAHNLGLKVIAEGVENEIQLKFLSQNRCDEVQGYYFYRPINAEDIELILKNEMVS